MSDWDGDREQDEICARVGVDSAFGYHIEMYGKADPFWSAPRRGDGTRFPCIGPDNEYTGCLGEACAARTCWAGELVPSAQYAPDDRPHLPTRERKGAKCHTCAFLVDACDGRIDCRKGHFDRTITTACLVRQRVPETVEIPCPDYQRAEPLRTDIATYLARRAERSAANRTRRHAALRAKRVS